MERTLVIYFVFSLALLVALVFDLGIGRALLIGVLLAIVLRIGFIAAGIEIIDCFQWILYIFGVFLLYTGIKLFFQKEDEEYKPQESSIYKLMNRLFHISTNANIEGRYTIRENDKLYFTTLSLVFLCLSVPIFCLPSTVFLL